MHAAAPGDTVIVADGVWTGEGNRDIDFGGKVITLRSANGPTACIIDCQGSESDSHRAFQFWHDETSDAVVQGFTIRNTWQQATTDGGAIQVYGASPTIRDNVSTGEGGGLYLSGYSSSEVVVRENVIEGNRALGPTFYSGGGGGVFIRDGFPLLLNNLIVGNQASAGGGGIRVFYDYSEAPLLVNNTFAWNAAGGQGGGIQVYAGRMCRNILHVCQV